MSCFYFTKYLLHSPLPETVPPPPPPPLVCPPENMIYKGLDEDESAFLQFVVDRQIEQEDEVVKNEIQEVSAYRVSQHVHT